MLEKIMIYWDGNTVFSSVSIMDLSTHSNTRLFFVKIIMSFVIDRSQPSVLS